MLLLAVLNLAVNANVPPSYQVRPVRFFPSGSTMGGATARNAKMKRRLPVKLSLLFQIIVVLRRVIIGWIASWPAQMMPSSMALATLTAAFKLVHNSYGTFSI